MGNILNIIVVGYGFAGQVHAKTYRSLTHSCHLAGIVECNNEHRSVAKRTLSGVSVYETLDQALADIGSDVVVDFCVPAPQNIKLAKTAVSFGVNRIMLEKPLGWSYPMAISLEEILHERDAIYLDTYLSSLGLSHLKEWIARERSEIDRVHIKFHKNRITDSFKGRGFDSDTPPDAWHIEGPHMVTIAMEIAGGISAIEDASLCDMTHNNKTLSNHGGAHATIKHNNGAITILSMDLCSNENARIVEVFLKNHISFRLRLPKSKATKLISYVEKIDHGLVVDSYAIEDHPMEQCVKHGIEYFLTNSPHPKSIAHGVNINAILQELTDASKENACTTLL